MKFFKPEDFYGCNGYRYEDACNKAAGIANAKLGDKLEKLRRDLVSKDKGISEAIVKNIFAELSQSSCEHPLEKIKPLKLMADYASYRWCFECECGAPMKPSAFEKVNDAFTDALK